MRNTRVEVQPTSAAARWLNWAALDFVICAPLGHYLQHQA